MTEETTDQKVEQAPAAADSLHKPSALMRIAAAAGIISWLILAIYVYSLVMNLVSIFSTPGAFPTLFSDQVSMLANLLYGPLMGGFYFLVLQGLAQLIYLGLDLSMKLDDLGDTEE